MFVWIKILGACIGKFFEECLTVSIATDVVSNVVGVLESKDNEIMAVFFGAKSAGCSGAGRMLDP